MKYINQIKAARLIGMTRTQWKYHMQVGHFDGLGFIIKLGSYRKVDQEALTKWFKENRS